MGKRRHFHRKKIAKAHYLVVFAVKRSPINVGDVTEKTHRAGNCCDALPTIAETSLISPGI
jgi:hypothetical protein